jgi:asparagine synthetase B (glutamine-hydrolysing)
MLSAFAEQPPSWSQWRRDGLRLACAPGDLAATGGECLAVAGFVSFEREGPRDLAAMLAGLGGGASWSSFAAGHYAAAFADLNRRTLSLVRDPSGAQLLFHARAGGLVLFATEVAPLLSHPEIGRALDRDAALEFLLNGALVFPTRTLFAGVRQVAPGAVLEFSGGSSAARRHWTGPWKAPERSPIAEPRALREALMNAVERCVGPEGRAAISLSGGIDSSVVAACAVDLLGRPNVEAFTYEFQDPDHPSEVPAAAEVCRHLGIRHHVVKVSFEQYRDSYLERTRLLEDPTCLIGLAHTALHAGKIRERGFSRCLYGHGLEEILGMGCHGYLDNLGMILGRLPRPDILLRFWGAGGAPETALRRLSRKIPLVKPPPAELHYPILCALESAGLIPDAAAFYPRALQDKVRPLIRSAPTMEFLDELRDLPLPVRLQLLKYSCYGLKLQSSAQLPFARAAGVALTAPALLLHDECLAPGFWGTARPGRALLRDAMKDLLPEAILRRAKLYYPVATTISSGQWRAELLRQLKARVGPSRRILSRTLDLDVEALRPCFDETQIRPAFQPFGSDNATRLALWHLLRVERGPNAPSPSWDELPAGV